MRNSLIEDYTLELMIINWLGKEFVDWDVILFVKTLLIIG